MTYWHVMVIVILIGGGDEHHISVIPFSDEYACGDALVGMVEALSDDHPGTYATCRMTDIPSGVEVRPVARPSQRP